MGHYHDIYLKSDVMLLTDVFESFRESCMKYRRLDPAHFCSSLGLSWVAMLKMTRHNIELFKNQQVNMLNVSESNKRGGICMISERYAKANNEYMKNYNLYKLSSYIMCLDANVLCGWLCPRYCQLGTLKMRTARSLPKNIL
jgi:hypothetical protein